MEGNNDEDVDGNPSPSSTDPPEAEHVWATSTLNEASRGNASPSEVGESLHCDRGHPSGRRFADDGDLGAYSEDDALPQSSGTYGSSSEAGAADDAVVDDAVVVGGGVISAYDDQNEDGTSAELPSTTTADHGELAAGLSMSTSSDGPPPSDEEIYAQEQPASSSTSLQSTVQYVVGSYSAQQPASSTADYDVALEDYDRASPDVEQQQPPPTNECYEQRDYSDVSFPVSSSHVTSPTPLTEASPPRISRDQSELYNSDVVVVHTLHPCIPEEEEEEEDEADLQQHHHHHHHHLLHHQQQQQHHHNHHHQHVHCLPSPSGQDDQCPSGSGIPGNQDIEPLSASFVRIVGQRFANMELPPDVSGPPPPLTPQKENLVDSVMRTVIGCSSSSSNLPPDHALLDDYRHHHHLHHHHHHHHQQQQQQHHHHHDIKDEVSSVADDDDGHSHYMVSDPMLNVIASTSVETTVTDSMSTTGLVTVSDNVIVAHMAHHVDGNVLVDHLASSSAGSCHAPDDMMSVAVSSDDHPGMQVQVSHIGNASNLHGYVSSSTGGVDGLAASLSGRAIILEATVDSTVGTDCQVVGSSDSHYTLDVEHRMISVSSLDDDYSNEVESAALAVNNDCNPETSVRGKIINDDDTGAQTSSRRHLIEQDDARDVNSTSIALGRSSEDVMHIISVAGPSEPMLDANSAIMDASSVMANTSRARRSGAKKKKTLQDECNDSGLWCDECRQSYEDGCPKHQVQTIYDKPVLTRAWASLPASYLSIARVENEDSEQLVYGVFAKKSIPKRTQFGPVEGVVVYVQQPNGAETQGDASDGGCAQQKSRDDAPLLQIETNDGQMMLIDTIDESVSNWMRFVRLARTLCEQNLVIVQHNEALYFTTTCDIPPRAELKVYYSEHYAQRRGIEFLESITQPKSFTASNWPCFECNQHFQTSEELQFHLNEHDTAEVGSSAGQVVQGVDQRVRKKPKGIKRKKGTLATNKFKIRKDENGTGGNDGEDGSLQSDQPGGRGRKLTIKSRHPLGEWICTQCNLAFDNNNTRNLHILTHAAMDVAAGGGGGGGDGANIEEGVVPVQSSDDVFKVVKVECSNAVNGTAANSDEKPDVTSNLYVAELHCCPECNLEFASKRELIEHAGFHGKIFFRYYVPKESPSAGAGGGSVGSALGGVSRGARNRAVRNVKNDVGRTNSCGIRGSNGDKAVGGLAKAGGGGNCGLAKARRSFRGLVNPAKPHKCEMCYKSFATEDRLQRHMLVHGNEDAKPLQCNECGKRFLNNSALACHIKVHSDERKLYECPICKEDFDQIVTLKNHVQVHCINNLFTCPSCQKIFEEYNQIRKHIRAFHSEKKFPCEHCEKIFPRPDKLKLHMLRHSNHREFLCANCGKQFKRKDKLKEHMKRMHSVEREHRIAMRHKRPPSSKKFIPKVLPTDYHRFIYKCHACLLGFKRRGMLVNHLAKRHPDIRPHTVPELNLPILKTTRDYYCQYCEKVYKSSSKRKAHILKQHPGAELPMSNRRKGGIPEIPGVPNPTFSQTVGSITTHPHNCEWCHKQYASKAKLLQHQRKKHYDLLPASQQTPRHQNREPSLSLQQQQQQQQQLGNEQYLAVQDTIARLLQQESPSDEMVEEENLTVEEQDLQQQQHLLSAQTQTSSLEYSDVDVVDGNGGDIKPILPIGSGSTNVYVEPAIIIASMDVADAQMDNLPHADLLTQAMSELTQPLVDYGHVIVNDVVHHVYDHTRTCISHATCPPPPSAVVVSTSVSPPSTPGPLPVQCSSSPTSNVDEAAAAAAAAAEDEEDHRTELGHLLGHYDVTVDADGQHSVIIVAEAEAIGMREENGIMSVDLVESTVGEDATVTAVATTTTTSSAAAATATTTVAAEFVHRTWTSTYSDYSAR